MPRFLDEAVYYATAPIRLFGRSRGFRLALAALCTLAVFSYGALLALDRLLPAGSGVPPELAKIAPPPPLPPVTRTSYLIAPVAVALRAIQRKLDDAAPRQFAGKNDNAVSSLLSKADIGITIERRTLSMAGKPNEMTVATPVTGTLRITGQIAEQAGNITGSIAGLIDKSIGSSVGKITNQVLDQRADIRGNVTVHARPAITADWRLQPNLTSQVTLADSTVVLAGFKIDVAGEAKPLIEREVNAQIGQTGDAPAQRPDARARGARAMGEDVPLDRARRRRNRPAPAVAGDEADPRRRRAAADRRAEHDADHRRAGRDPHHRAREQAELPVPGRARTGAADAERQAVGRPADRRAVCRAQQSADGAAQGPHFPGQRRRRGARRSARRRARRRRRAAADHAAR